jgi:hypothetical protein
MYDFRALVFEAVFLENAKMLTSIGLFCAVSYVCTLQREETTGFRCTFHLNCGKYLRIVEEEKVAPPFSLMAGGAHEGAASGGTLQGI